MWGLTTIYTAAAVYTRVRSNYFQLDWRSDTNTSKDTAGLFQDFSRSFSQVSATSRNLKMQLYLLYLFLVSKQEEDVAQQLAQTTAVSPLSK